jgi:hypothetical protein
LGIVGVRLGKAEPYPYYTQPYPYYTNITQQYNYNLFIFYTQTNY